jgi:hypothetical protein
MHHDGNGWNAGAHGSPFSRDPFMRREMVSQWRGRVRLRVVADIFLVDVHELGGKEMIWCMISQQ